MVVRPPSTCKFTHSLIHSLIHSFVRSFIRMTTKSNQVKLLLAWWIIDALEVTARSGRIAELKFLIYVKTSIQFTHTQRQQTTDNTPNHMELALSTHSSSRRRRSIPLVQIKFKANLIKSISLSISLLICVHTAKLILPPPFFCHFFACELRS